MPDAETTTTTTTATTSSPLSKAKLVHWQEVQDTVSRLAAHKGVLAISILNSNGDIVTQQTTSDGQARKAAMNSTNSNTSSVLGNPKLLKEMMKTANQYVRSLSGHDEKESASPESPEESSSSEAAATPKEDISFVRIRTQKDEILVAPKLGYTLVVLQDPALSSL